MIHFSLMMAIHLPFLDSSENIADILSYPIYNDQFDCFVPHVKSPFDIIVQDKRNLETLSVFLQDLYTAYSESGMYFIELSLDFNAINTYFILFFSMKLVLNLN